MICLKTIATNTFSLRVWCFFSGLICGVARLPWVGQDVVPPVGQGVARQFAGGLQETPDRAVSKLFSTHIIDLSSFI